MTKYFVDPLVNIRCLEGVVLAIGDEPIEFEGAESILLAAFAAPRTLDEAVSFLDSHHMPCERATIEQDVRMLHENGVLREYQTAGHEQLMEAGGRDLHRNDLFHSVFGHSQSLVENTWTDREGRPVPPTTYGIAHWLKRYDISDKKVLLTSGDTSVEWWSNNCASVTLIKTEGVSALALTALANVSVVETIDADSDKFDIVEVTSPQPDLLKNVDAVVKPTGVLLVPFPEWQRDTLDILAQTSRIEVTTSGFIPGIESHVGYSLFIGREFDWKKRPLELPLGGIDFDADPSKPLTGQHPRVSLAPSARTGTPSLRPSLRPKKK